MSQRRWVYSSIALVSMLCAYAGFSGIPGVLAAGDVPGGDGVGTTAGGTCVQGQSCEPIQGACGGIGSCVNFHCVCGKDTSGKCGDGFVDRIGGEQCDMGAQNGPNSVCSSTCQLNFPTCTLEASTYLTVVDSGVSFVVSGVNRSYTTISNCILTYDDGSTGAYNGSGWSTPHAYQATGIYVPSVECRYYVGGSDIPRTLSCEVPQDIVVYTTGVNPACLSTFAHLTYAYSVTQQGMDGLSADIWSYQGGGFVTYTGHTNINVMMNVLTALGVTNMTYSTNVYSHTGALLVSNFQGNVTATGGLPTLFTVPGGGTGANFPGYPLTVKTTLSFEWNGETFTFNGSHTIESNERWFDCDPNQTSCALWMGLYCAGPSSTGGNLCGNGVVDVDETCDDGGTVDGDGCSAKCLLEDPQTPLPSFEKVAEVGQSGDITVIHYTVTAYIAKGETQATIYDGLSQGGDMASIDTGSLVITPHSSNPSAHFTLGDVEGFINAQGNVWAYLAHVSGQGGTWFTIKYDVIPTEAGMVCNLCQLFTGTYIPGDNGGTAMFFAPAVYADGAPADQVEICSFVPHFTKSIVSTTTDTITYRIDGTIATGGTAFTVTDDFGPLTQVGPLTYGPTGVPGLTFTPLAGGVPGATSFSIDIKNTTTHTQSYFILFTVTLPQSGEACNQASVNRTATYGGSFSTNEYISDNPDTSWPTNDQTCGCPAGQIFQNGDCRVVTTCNDTTLPSDQGAIVVCNSDATGANQSYVYDASCTAGCAYTCADDHIRVGNTCVAVCDADTLPANMLGVEICSNGLLPPSTTGYTFVPGGCANAGSILCPFSCSQGYSRNGTECTPNVCSGTLPDNAAFCGSPQIPATNNEPITFNTGCVTPYPADACDFSCNPGFVWDSSLGECIESNYMSKTAELHGSIITYTIQGTLVPGTLGTTITLNDTTAGPAVVNHDVQFSSADGLTADAAVYTSNGFQIHITRDNDGGTFTITYTAHATYGGNEEICNQATITAASTTVLFYSDNLTTPSPDDGLSPDPTCVSGYDLEMIKYVQPTWSSSDVYPDNIANGIVYHGDRYVYHVEVVNNGPGDAFNAHVSDTFPAGVTGFRSENLPAGVTFVPPLTEGANSFTWNIDTLLVGEHMGFDVWVKFDNTIAGLSEGDTYCNVATVVASGEVSPENNFDARSSNDDACLTLGTCDPNRTCKGEIYATGFVWTTNGTTEAGTVRVDATCVVEATCNDSDTFAAEPAELVYGQTEFTVTKGQGTTIQLPSDHEGGVTGVSLNVPSLGNACTYITQRIADKDGRSSSPQDFQNYTVSSCEVAGNQVTFTVQHRVWKHWLSCRKQPLNACSTPYALATYEIASAARESLEDVAANQVLTATPDGGYVQWRPSVGINVHDWENHGCNLCGGGDGPDCGDHICTVCPAGTYANFTNMGGSGEPTAQCLCVSTGQPPVNGECPDVPSPSKTVTVSGTLLTYTLSGLHIPAGQPGVLVTDEISGNVQLIGSSVQLMGNGVMLAGINITATSLEAYITRVGGGVGSGPVYFGMSYQAEILGSGASQICNQASVSTGNGAYPFAVTNNPGTPTANDATCICGPTQACNPTPGTGTVFKTAVVSGNLIYYTVTVTMPGAGSVVVSDVLSGGAIYTNDFVGHATSGTGTFSWSPQPATTNVNFIVTNGSAGPLVFVITYTASVVSSADAAYYSGLICNAVHLGTLSGNVVLSGFDVSHGGSLTHTSFTDATASLADSGASLVCVCRPGYEVCDTTCVPVGECNPYVTGDIKKDVIMSGDALVYTIVATLPQPGTMIVTDHLSGNAIYDNDFTGAATSGTGNFTWSPNPAVADVSFEITNAGPGVLVYVITYTVKVPDKPAHIQSQICNYAQVSGGNSTASTCSCPANTELCNEQCVPTGTCNPGGGTGYVTIHKVVNTTGAFLGDPISYSITITNPSAVFVSGYTVTDTLPVYATGLFTPTADYTTSGVYVWNVSLPVLAPGATYTITFSGEIACQGANCPAVGSTMCNVASVNLGSTGTQQSDSACTKIIECTDDADCNGYCDDGICVGDAMCSSFVLQPTTGSAPLTSTFTCVGIGGGYYVTVMDGSGNVLASGNSATGTLTFTQGGTYTVQCAVGNDVGTQCNNLPLGVTGAQQLLANYATQLGAANILSGGVLINRAGFAATSIGDYLNVTTEELISELANNATAYAIQQLLVNVYSGSDPILYDAPGGPLQTQISQMTSVLWSIAQQLVAEKCIQICQATVHVTQNTNDTCQDLSTLDATNVEQASHTVHFTCEAAPSFVGASMQILCDSTNASGVILSGNAQAASGKAIFDGTCTYTGYNAYKARCIVDGGVDLDNSCEQLVLLKYSGGGGGPGGGGSNGGGSNGGGSNGGGGGSGSPLNPKGDEPKCAYIDPPSVHVGEYVPFRWDLEPNSRFSYTSDHSCTNKPSGTILKNDMICHFSLYNGKSQNPITTVSEPCFGSKWGSNAIFKDQYFKESSIQNSIGKSYLKVGPDLVGTTFGEYQIVLDKITYSTCDGTNVQQRTYDGRVCAMNFAIANGYLMHEGVGLSTISDTDLSKFKNLRGDPIIPQQELRSITRLMQAVASSSDRDYLLEKVVNENASLATTSVDRIGTTNILSNKLKKVPAKEIYVVEGDLTIRNVTSTKEASYTLIVRHGTLTIEGSVDTNGMYIVPDGQIIFNTLDCDQRDVVQGIYMTRAGFAADKVRNDNLAATNWCMEGGLVVEGMLIGPNIGDEEFINSKRATLRDWFDLNDSTQKEKIFGGASILIKTNPSLWRNLPPAANQFMERLNIWK